MYFLHYFTAKIKLRFLTSFKIDTCVTSRGLTVCAYLDHVTEHNVFDASGELVYRGKLPLIIAVAIITSHRDEARHFVILPTAFYDEMPTETDQSRPSLGSPTRISSHSVCIETHRMIGNLAS